AGLLDVGVHPGAGRDLVVEPGEPQAVLGGLHPHPGEDRGGGPGGQRPGGPGDRVGERVSVDSELHSDLPPACRPPFTGRRLPSPYPPVPTVHRRSAGVRGGQEALFGLSVQTTVIRPVTVPSSVRSSISTGNSGRPPASSSARTSSRVRPSVASAMTSPIASLR